MKKGKARKSYSLLIVIILLFGCLSGCGKAGSMANANNGTETGTSGKDGPGAFRNIPFGTKYQEALELMKANLKEQGYTAEPNDEIALNPRYPDVRYENIRLYDYTASAGLHFVNEEDTGNDEDSILYGGFYSIKNGSAEEAENCYQYFYEKLKEKYGEGEAYSEHEDAGKFSSDTNGMKWSDEGTAISISRTAFENEEYNELYGRFVTINYESERIGKQIREEAENSKKAEENNINSGL